MFELGFLLICSAAASTILLVLENAFEKELQGKEIKSKRSVK